MAPACSAVQNFTPRDFEGCTWVADGNVKLLGAAIGLDAIGRHQGAIALLRSCTGWAKILYSCRTVPPSLQAQNLGKTNRDIRHSLGRLLGGLLTDEDWRLASIGVANVASELAAHRNTLPPHTSQAWPSPKSSARASGWASTSTTSTEVTGALTLNRAPTPAL